MLRRTWKSEEAMLLLGAAHGFLASAPATPKQRALLEVVARRVGLDAVPPPVPPAGLTSLGLSERTEAIRLLLMLTCLGEEVRASHLDELAKLNRALKQKPSWPQTLRLGQRGQTTRATLALGRWAPDARALLRLVWRDEGLFGVLRAMRSAQGKGPPNPAVAARYAKLEKLPADTLGAAFWNHMRTRKLPMPGEAGGLPERGLHHDLMHVVTGLDTDARGEGRLAGVYTGATSRHPIAGADPFTFVMVALMTFELGFKVGPSFVGAERGVIEPAELFALIDVGGGVAINVISDWRFQDDFERPLGEVRRDLGLHPDGAMAMISSA